MPWRRACNPPQYSCLENPKDRGAWWAAVHAVAQSGTRLKRPGTHARERSGNTRMDLVSHVTRQGLKSHTRRVTTDGSPILPGGATGWLRSRRSGCSRGWKRLSRTPQTRAEGKLATRKQEPHGAGRRPRRGAESLGAQHQPHLHTNTQAPWARAVRGGGGR